MFLQEDSKACSRAGFSGHFFDFLRLIFICFVVALFDLVHDVEAIFYHPWHH